MVLDRLTSNLYRLKCECGIIMSRTNTALHGKKPIRSCSKCKRQKPAGDISYKELYTTCKRAAAERGLEFAMTMEQHKILSKNKCYCCGTLPSSYNKYLKIDGSRRSGNENISKEAVSRAWVEANGIDRIDSTKGYTLGNIAACCYDCNVAKAEKSLAEYISHCKKVVKFNENL